MKTKMIYSLKLYVQLIILGFQPITAIPNPKYPKYTCWIFEDTDEFEEAFSSIVGEQNHGSK